MDEDVDDNLTKMAITVLGRSAYHLKKFEDSKADAATIEERISRDRALMLLEEWKKIKIAHDKIIPH